MVGNVLFEKNKDIPWEEVLAVIESTFPLEAEDRSIFLAAWVAMEIP